MVASYKTNEWVVHELDEKRQMLQGIKECKTGYYWLEKDSYLANDTICRWRTKKKNNWRYDDIVDFDSWMLYFVVFLSTNHAYSCFILFYCIVNLYVTALHFFVFNHTAM